MRISTAFSYELEKYHGMWYSNLSKINSHKKERIIEPMDKSKGILVLVSSGNAGKLAAILEVLTTSGRNPVVTGEPMPEDINSHPPVTDLCLYRIAEERGIYLIKKFSGAHIAIGMDGRIVVKDKTPFFQAGVCIFAKRQGVWRKTVSAVSDIRPVALKRARANTGINPLPTGAKIMAETVGEALKDVCIS